MQKAERASLLGLQHCSLPAWVQAQLGLTETSAQKYQLQVQLTLLFVALIPVPALAAAAAAAWLAAAATAAAWVAAADAAWVDAAAAAAAWVAADAAAASGASPDVPLDQHQVALVAAHALCLHLEAYAVADEQHLPLQHQQPAVLQSGLPATPKMIHETAAVVMHVR